MFDEVKSGLRKFLSTLFFFGHIPGYPQIYGSLLMIALLWFTKEPLALYLQPASMKSVLFFLTLAIVGASWLCNDTEQNFGRYNAKPVIIDAFIGQFIVFLFVPISLASLLVGFTLYQFFSVIKPWPIYPFTEVDEGVGIVMDDVMAGIAAAVSLEGLFYFYGIISAYLV